MVEKKGLGSLLAKPMPDDQLMDLSEKLNTHAARPEEAVKILKVLENVAITYD